MKYKFGEKIRAIREKKKITMREVAEKASVSESLMSQIERNKISPAIDTLLRIADVLDIDLEYLFIDYKKNRCVNIVRSQQRDVYKVKDVLYEQLCRTPGKTEYGIEAYMMQIEVGGESKSEEYGHPGKELGVIIEGQGVFKIGSESYVIEEGDSISFDSDIPHRLINDGKKPLKAFWVITPPRMF
ncbi:MAG: XRE family transcriptional regulator [Spirochaetes bacterium]|jgi:transcriptional regulator with XRE-family HTH domain|nr:XRE family transcriptional regulator [Spirochaetota bacterium]